MIAKVPFNLHHPRNPEFPNLCLLQNYLLALLKHRGLGPTSRLSTKHSLWNMFPGNCEDASLGTKHLQSSIVSLWVHK